MGAELVVSMARNNAVRSAGSHARSHPSRLLRLGARREGLRGSRQVRRDRCAEGPRYCTRGIGSTSSSTTSCRACASAESLFLFVCTAAGPPPYVVDRVSRDRAERSSPPEFPFRLCVR